MGIMIGPFFESCKIEKSLILIECKNQQSRSTPAKETTVDSDNKSRGSQCSAVNNELRI